MPDLYPLYCEHLRHKLHGTAIQSAVSKAVLELGADFIVSMRRSLPSVSD
jgi:hypothetical protein